MPAGTTRLERLRRVALRRADALLVTHLPNIRYLSGFAGSSAVLGVMRRRAVLFVPHLYRLQAAQEARGVAVRSVPGSLVPAAGHWLARQRLARVAYEEDHLSAAQRAQLQRLLGRKQVLVATAGLVERIRARKEAGEIELLRGALQVTARAFEEVLPLVRPGVRECELAAELEYRMKQQGASGMAFETIVASGARSALPHGRARAKRLAKNELVVFDLGAILAGYHGDLTRTVFLGTPPARVKHVYAAVQEALERARQAVGVGVPASRVDAAVRAVLAGRRLGRYFAHGTGHGVGLEIHEEPRIGQGVETRLASGHVMTLEPGVYLPGWGGVRIEDVVVVGRAGARTLTPLSAELIVL